MTQVSPRRPRKVFVMNVSGLLGSDVDIWIRLLEFIGRPAYIKKRDNEFYLIAE